MNQAKEMAMREFTLQFSKRTFDWFVVTQPTIKTEDGYTTRVIEISACHAGRGGDSKANAHLIAAAPDLLQLAIELSEETTLPENSYYKMLAKQLLKKVRG